MKKKRKPKAALAKQTLQLLGKPTPVPWVPPHPQKLKTPAVGDKLFTKFPVTYRISPAPKDTEEKTTSVSPPEWETVRLRNQQARKEFLKKFRSLAGRWRTWDIWTDFVTIIACTISNAVDATHYDEREKTYLRIIEKYNKEEQNTFVELYAHLVLALEENPEQDFLGDIYTELGLNNKEHAQIFTPYHICQFMAEITLDGLGAKVEEKGVVEVHDPCCGAGATLIAASNVAKKKLDKVNLNYQNHILLTGQDIDHIVTMMCYIQISLLGMAGYFKVGNSLSDPMTNGDSLENYWFTPMYFFPIWHYRRILNELGRLFESAEDTGD